MAQSTKAKADTDKTANKAKQEKQSSYAGIAKQLADGTYKGKKTGGTKYYDTYRETDGSVILAYYNSPIRYEDEKGELKEYDSKLISVESKDAVDYSGDTMSESYNTDTYSYVNKAGDSKQYLPDELNQDTPILMEQGNYSLAFHPEGIDENKVVLNDGKAEYILQDKSTTYQYESFNNGVKENIIFNKAPKENTYSFSYTLDGMYMKEDRKTNTIGLFDDKTNSQVALLQAPFLNDNSKCNYSYDIDVKISNDDNQWTVTYILPQKYLKNKNTSYPVTLDPTVVWVTENNPNEPIGISYVIELPGAGDYVQYNNAVNRFTIGRSGAGDYYKTYIQFKNLNSQLKGKIVNYAVANISVAQQVGGEMKVDMHEVKEGWNLMELTWATQPKVSEDVLSQSVIELEDRSYEIDFTKYCNMVAKGQADATKGVELRTEQNSKYMEFWGIRNQEKAPLFIISYSSSPENLKTSYDGTFNIISGDYDAETGKIKVTWDEHPDAVTDYMVCKRVQDTFEPIGYTVDTSFEVPVDDINTIADIRVVARDNHGTNATELDDEYVLSNILTFEKKTETDNGEAKKTYHITKIDIDGDELEDGYEIWDFKTDPNNLDSDGDGFPDGYEVFTFGTDPAVYTPDKDSDGDGLTNLQEYQLGTDSYLEDSDFDEKLDGEDSEPRKTNNSINRLKASQAEVHIGLYDRVYTEEEFNTETEDVVTYTYIQNIYSGDIKSKDIDYRDELLNKKNIYFYDENHNNTAIIEVYNSVTTTNNIICKTYTYDSIGNIVYICDNNNTNYTMNYNDNSDLTGMYVGNQMLINYMRLNLIDNTGENGDISHPIEGDIISKDQKTSTYGNQQKIKTVTTKYKTNQNNNDLISERVETYYNNDTQKSYEAEYNSAGNIIKSNDYTKNVQNPLIKTYSYSDTGMTMSRNDGFSKTLIETVDEENGTLKSLASIYTFEDVRGDTTTYSNTIYKDKTDEETGNPISSVQLFNSGSATYETDKVNGKTTDKIYAKGIQDYVISGTETRNSKTNTTYEIEGKNYSKLIDYTYDLMGNITKIKVNNQIVSEYVYDGHGRLTSEKDYRTSKEYVYRYDTIGTPAEKVTYPIDSSGNRQSLWMNIKNGRYANSDWPDQLTEYDGQTITYDGNGNPLTYLYDMSFTWERGRTLKDIKVNNVIQATYEYNEENLRTYQSQ